MKKFNKREKLLALLVGIAVVLFATERLIISPFLKELGEFPAKKKQAEVDLKSALAVAKAQKKILKDYRTYQSYFSQDTAPKEMMAEFLKEIEQMAERAKIEIISLNPRGQRGSRYEVKLKGQAGMKGLLQFLYQIQESNILMEIDQFIIRSKRGESRVLTMDFSLSRISL